MNAIIIYSGKYGATKQYATWLGEELEITVMPSKDIERKDLDKYDTLLLGTSVYIGKLQIAKWIKKNIDLLKGKKIFFFQVAGTPVQEKEKRQSYNLKGLPEELIDDCEFYFLPGRMIMKKLSWLDRFLLKMGSRMVKDPKEKKTMLTDYDEVKKENLEEMIASVNGYFTSRQLVAISHQ